MIQHARRSLLFNKGEPWVKKAEEHFDVTMGAYDGAEVCELVGIYIQSQLSKMFDKKNFGLYRDDGLAVFRKISGPESERVKKEFHRIFKANHLDITISCNLKVVNYLDLTLNLNDGTYRPYHKPNDEIMYIHKESNHPPGIIKQLPLSVESRLRNISSSKQIFNDSIKVYQDALERSGFKHKLTYEDPENPSTTSNRKRKVIWFNPPYSKSVKTNVGKRFLNLLDKHFPPHNKLRKIFNRNTLKVSYSCLPSIKAKINQHNKKLLEKDPIEVSSISARMCNCPKDTECPLNKFCLDKDVFYTGELTSNLNNYRTRIYKGICSTTFKERLGNHRKAFKHEKYKADSEISKEIWRIKRKGGEYHVKWKKVKNYTSYKPERKRCNLCDNEKLEIALHKEENLLNQKNEIISRCRHRFKYKLANIAF